MTVTEYYQFKSPGEQWGGMLCQSHLKTWASAGASHVQFMDNSNAVLNGSPEGRVYKCRRIRKMHRAGKATPRPPAAAAPAGIGLSQVEAPKRAASEAAEGRPVAAPVEALLAHDVPAKQARKLRQAALRLLLEALGGVAEPCGRSEPGKRAWPQGEHWHWHRRSHSTSAPQPLPLSTPLELPHPARTEQPAPTHPLRSDS